MYKYNSMWWQPCGHHMVVSHLFLVQPRVYPQYACTMNHKKLLASQLAQLTQLLRGTVMSMKTRPTKDFMEIEAKQNQACFHRQKPAMATRWQ